jgi:NDP-mannose synthase
MSQAERPLERPAFEPELAPRVELAVADARHPGALVDTKAVILAGGRGARLAPHTSILPKPLMPVGDRAILEIVVSDLARAGIGQITLCVGYLAHLIQAVFGNGSLRGVDIRYTHELKPLGTAAPLHLVEGLTQDFIVTNGDVLCDIDYAALLEEHRSAGNLLTVAIHQRKITMNYGVVHLEADASASPRIARYEEKPELTAMVSTGIYVIDPAALAHVPRDERFDIPDLVWKLLRMGERVGAYVHEGLWFDIGRHEDYEEAVTAWHSLETA